MDHLERNQQKKRRIEEGLLWLMQQQPYSQITVTSLTESMGMSRKSFYHYFSNIESCLESMMDSEIREAALHVMQLSAEKDISYGVYVNNLRYWKERECFLSAVARNSLDAVFLDRFSVYCTEENATLQNLMCLSEKNLDEDVLLFFLSGLTSLLLRWCQRGFTPPVEEMARKFQRLFHAPLICSGE